MTRYEFLKTAGFTGGALVSLLMSCTKDEDSFVEALTLSPTEAVNANTTNTTGTGGEVITTNGLISTTELNKITGVKLKLAIADNPNLTKSSGYVVKSGIVVALNKSGKLIAATNTCSHEPKKQVIFSNEEWYCTAHGARFSMVGAGLNGNGKKGLTIYKVASDGTSIVVY